MKSSVRLCQFSPAINRGDAMSQQALAIHCAAESAGIEAALFEFGKGNATSAPIHLYTEYEPRPDDVIVLNYGAHRHYEDWVPQLPGRVYFYYHNVTPARFFERIEFPWIEALYHGRDTLSEFAHLGGLAASEYNKRELMQAGFRDVHVIPYILDFDTFTQAARTPAAMEIIAKHQRPGVVNWLHVGRIAPNKRIEDIIRAFCVYHTGINSDSHLFLVGPGDKELEAYSQPIHRWVKELSIQDAVTFTGQISDRNQVAGFYQAADLYICMSEHEGFCIPLLEAMIHRVPIIAFRRAAVGHTMGDAGIVVDSKDPHLIAQIARLLCQSPTYREEIIAGQLEQAEVWHSSKALRAFYTWIQTL